MTADKFLAFDFGAESGRAIVGIIDDGSLTLEEVHRFGNRQTEIAGHLHWDFPYLLGELKQGLVLAAGRGHDDISSIGIDTWGVDFGLIGNDGGLIEFPHAYRDSRTDGMMEKVFARIPKSEIYDSTGIQFMQINSLYQLAAAMEEVPNLVEKCRALLFMPDLFNYFCSGIICSEYTIASTSQILNATTRTWDEHILSALALPRRILAPIVQPGTVVGQLQPEISREAGFKSDVEVVTVGCHDTASAVAAIPALEGDWAYLSSGTWSIIGIESDKPFLSAEALKGDFTNEGGVGGTIRFLRNTTGMWLLQQCRSSWQRAGRTLSYDELIRLASTASPFVSFIDPADRSFLNPSDMPEAICGYCARTGQPVPEHPPDMVRCIIESLAMTARSVIEEIRRVTKKNICTLHIVGGGSRNRLLNQFIADAAGIPVVAGPAEATAIGNIIVQAASRGTIRSLRSGRELVARSFRLESFAPRDTEHWNTSYHQFQKVIFRNP